MKKLIIQSDPTCDMNEGQGPKQPKSVEAILSERGKTHGKFSDHARITQTFKSIAYDSTGFLHADQMTDVEREALDMIFHKIGRILAGNPHFKDHWDDIAGYATLVSQSIQEK